MITGKIKKHHLLFFILLAICLVLSLIGVALYRGEQHPEVETFRLVFYFSVFGTIVFAILLVIGITYLLRWKRLSINT